MTQKRLGKELSDLIDNVQPELMKTEIMPKTLDMYDLEKYLHAKNFVCCKTVFKAQCFALCLNTQKSTCCLNTLYL